MLDDVESNDDPYSDDDALPFSKRLLRVNPFGEQFFGIYAPLAARKGWSVYPQMRDEKRRPCRIDDETLKWSKYQEVAPTPAEIERWRHQVLDENMAVILGRSSGNAFAIDIDVDDEDLAWQIEMIANETLGPTNWRRIGNPPKVAILFRVATPEEIPAWRQCKLANPDGSPSRHMVEILGHGRSMTAFGRHWKTGLQFEWSTGFSPISDSPMAVPCVDAAMIEAFLARVEAEVAPFHRHSVSVSDFAGGTERFEGEVVVPSVWLEYPKGPDGKIVDGRKQFLWQLCRTTVRRNAEAVLTDEGLAAIQAVLMREFEAACAMTGEWGTLSLLTEIAEKTRRLKAQVEAGTLQPMRRSYVPKSTAVAPVVELPDGFFDIQSSLRWLPATSSKVSILAAESNFDPRSRAIDESSEAESERVAQDLDAALDRVLDDLLDERLEGADAPAHLLKVPTGAGKTSRLIHHLADRAVIWREEQGEPLRCILAVPSHQNAEEALVRALDAGLSAMIYRGKMRPGMCERQDVIKPLSEAGIGTSGVCHAKIDSVTAPDGLDVYCPFFETCAYQRQKREVADCDLVIVPHAYVGLGKRIPEILSENARFVVVDEDLSGTVLHTAAMPIRTLTLPRKPPYRTKAERAAGVDPEDHLFDRAEACRIAVAEVQAGRDPALALLTAERGLELIDAAIAVTGRSDRVESKLTPTTSLDAVEFFASMVKGSHVREEWRFWTLVRERFMHLQLDLVATTGGNVTRVAKGATDARIRRVRRWIRMAWLSEPALRSLPVLHMDASAEPRVVQKIVGRSMEVTEITAKIRQITTLIPDATYSKSSLLSRAGETVAVRVRKGKKLQRIREAIATVCAHHGDGDVVCVAPLAVEEHLCGLGKWPVNLRWMHYGATRGLDYAKDAVALISIGDLNAKLESYDDLVAALTYDEDRPEAMMVDADGSCPPYRTVQELVPMRDGTALVLDVCRFEGETASTFQRSIRDHEILQAWGRLRPVHRHTPGYVYHLGRTIPAGTIVDAVVSLDDLVRPVGAVAEALVDMNGFAVAADIEAAAGAQFDGLVDKIEADPTLHPGLAIVRDGEGTPALLMRAAGDETRDLLQRQGYDLAAIPAPAQKPMSEADIAREAAEQERRWSAWEQLLEGEVWVQENMRRDAAGMWWLQEGVDWGQTRKGEPEMPIPMTLREAVQVVRDTVLPALEDEEAGEVEVRKAA